jgi:hypothetical protein
MTMKRIHTIQKIPLILALALLAACGKKDDASPKAQASLLTTSPWTSVKNEDRTTEGAWLSPAPYGNFQYYPGMTVTYFDNGAYSVSPGGQAGTWQLSNGGKTLTLFTSTGASRTLTISSLTSGTLVFSAPLDPKSNYTTHNSGTPGETFTYYDTQRTTLTR